VQRVEGVERQGVKMCRIIDGRQGVHDIMMQRTVLYCKPTALNEMTAGETGGALVAGGMSLMSALSLHE
jgi:hypothetical protein